ncbi:hypothetical protein [Brevibacillus porteri]|uniref:hypothetical protein n=1 Tax=Brevibacillus porteri TaxID=2126350 RepID=UPI003D1D0C74
MNKRDLHADLAACDAATTGPWLYDNGDIVSVSLEYESVEIYNPYNGAKDARFVAEARTGWPHAIERAIAAEAEVERLRNTLIAIRTRCAGDAPYTTTGAISTIAYRALYPKGATD